MTAMLKLEWLEAFATFAEHQSFTAAARVLHISQPALHVQVKKLGEALGVPLYQRKGQRLVLTVEGLSVAAFGRDLRDRTRDLADSLTSGRRNEPVVLCAGEGAYLYLLGDAIRTVIQGGGRVKLVTRDREGTLDAVRAGDAHVGVAALDVPPDDLDARLLTEVGQVLVVPKAHALARKRRVRLTDLAGALLVVPGPDRPHRMAIARAMLAAAVPWEVAVEANGWELMLRFVELGVGLAIVNECCRIPKGLVARRLTELPQQRYVVVRRRGAATRGGAADLARALLATGDAWRITGATARADSRR